MPTINVSFERLFFGNKHWSTPGAIDEVEIYCDLLDNLQERVDSLETRGKGEEVTLVKVQAFISTYAFEIAMKSLWTLEHCGKKVPHDHDMLKVFVELEQDTKNALERLEITREILESYPKPFQSNRYSMERLDEEKPGESTSELTDEEKRGRRTLLAFHPKFLRSLIELMTNRLDKSRATLLNP